jgi:YD repeat-containing protein
MKITTICAALLLLPSLAMAGVNAKNGDFYITYGDIELNSDKGKIEVTRTYNSKASGEGWFGAGWGSVYETYVSVMPDGSVVVHENGLGNSEYYAPKNANGLQAGINKIIEVAAQKDHLDPDEVTTLRKNLLGDQSLRASTVLKYGIQSQLAVGDYAQSDVCDTARVTRIATGYKRTYCGSKIDYFDQNGHLIRMDNDGYQVVINYAGNYPDRIEDNQGHKIFLMWTASGHIASATTDTGAPRINYYYDAQGNLLLSDEIGGNFYKYQYDKNHNMTRIGYIDNTHMDMTYNDNALISSVSDTKGNRTNYEYRLDPENPLMHYWTKITEISASGAQSVRELEFRLATDAAGVEQIAAVSRTSDNSKSDTVLDDRGRIKLVHKPDGGFVEYFYHPTLNKLSAVVTDEISTVFSYNKTGDLSRAYNTGGQLIELNYDEKSHITRMTESNQITHTRRVLSFKYNAQGKPTVIKLLGKGEIRVDYDAQGEISKVESKQGVLMAMGVTEAFQTLLKVVKVAGVDM